MDGTFFFFLCLKGIDSLIADGTKDLLILSFQGQKSLAGRAPLHPKDAVCAAEPVLVFCGFQTVQLPTDHLTGLDVCFEKL